MQDDCILRKGVVSWGVEGLLLGAGSRQVTQPTGLGFRV